MFVIFVLAFKIISAEGRVFCQDSKAAPWSALGDPCPITCSTVITAVDRLKLKDYQYLLDEKTSNRINISAIELYTLGQQLKENIVYGRKSKSLPPDLRNHIKLYNTYHRLLNNENFDGALKKEVKKMAVELNRTCSNMVAKQYFYAKYVINNKCTRKLNKRPEVLEKFTKFLNKFADKRYPFDEEMAGLILQKLEENLNLRFGEVDFKRILDYLRKALRYHGSNTKSDQVFRLQSRNCLTIYLPGCYCKIGFVESKGQCVKPGDCIDSSVFREYLERIIFH